MSASPHLHGTIFCIVILGGFPLGEPREGARGAVCPEPQDAYIYIYIYIYIYSYIGLINL